MQVTYKLVGTRPMLMHNGRLVDPLDPHVKAIKEITGKRSKTDDDLEELAVRELIGGMYFNDDGPCIPGENIEACLRDGAKFRKLGKRMQQGVMVLDFEARLEYDGPRTPEELAVDVRFRSRVPVKVGQQRVVRTRARFTHWSLTCDVQFEETHVDVEDIDQAFRDAGQFIGLGDWRPRYGRFTAERIG